MDEEKVEISEQKTVTPTVTAIDWILPSDEITTPFASNMLVQTMEDEFKVSFFEIKPVIRLNESDPIPSKVKAVCVASVIITADRLPRFIKVLQDQFNKYNLKKQAKVTP